jgi:hypothetical protein
MDEETQSYIDGQLQVMRAMLDMETTRAVSTEDALSDRLDHLQDDLLNGVYAPKDPPPPEEPTPPVE